MPGNDGFDMDISEGYFVDKEATLLVGPFLSGIDGTHEYVGSLGQRWQALLYIYIMITTPDYIITVVIS